MKLLDMNDRKGWKCVESIEEEKRVLSSLYNSLSLLFNQIWLDWIVETL